jgi:hypothetical protein
MDALHETLKDDQQKDVNLFVQKQKELLLNTKDLNKHVIKENEAKNLENAVDNDFKKLNKIPSLISVKKKKNEDGDGDNSKFVGDDNNVVANKSKEDNKNFKKHSIDNSKKFEKKENFKKKKQN